MTKLMNRFKNQISENPSMSFNVKFLIVAVSLSAASAFFQFGVSDILSWLMVTYRWQPEFLSAVHVGLAPVHLAVSVILPFSVIYTLGRKVGSAQAYRPIIVSIFFGCWLGQIFVFYVDFVVRYFYLGGYYSPVWISAFWLIWESFALALSGVFFLALAAILFAYYQTTITKKQPAIDMSNQEKSVSYPSSASE